ncbi:hypothetical protein J3E69DRAFT_372431 [Trichoderma sp. SZMC 28015]
MAPPKPQLLFTITEYLSKTPVEIGPVKSGAKRIFYPTESGHISGPALGDKEAKITPGGGDWLLLDDKAKALHLNMRLCASIPDGNALYITIRGIIRLNEAVLKVIESAPDAKSTDFTDQDFWGSLIVETNSGSLKHLETSLLIAQGRFFIEGDLVGAQHEVYALAH